MRSWGRLRRCWSSGRAKTRGGGHDGRHAPTSKLRPALTDRYPRPPSHVRALLGGIDELLVYDLAMNVRFRRVTSRDGLLLHGEFGWAEAAPFWDYDPAESSTWLEGAIDAASSPGPRLHRDAVPVNVTIPVVSAESARDRVIRSRGCATAKVKVADPGARLEDDAERVRAVARALAETVGDEGRVRVDANAAWTADEAIAAIELLDGAAEAVGGLQYVEQPCASIEELARVRRAVRAPIAADESIRRARDPLAVAREGAADVAVIKIAPLGGIRRALRIGEETGLRLVVSSALESSIGLQVGVRAAASIPGEVLACGLATASFLASDVVAEPVRVEAGALPLRELEPDLRLLASPVDEALRARWIDRLDAMAVHLGERR